MPVSLRRASRDVGGAPVPSQRSESRVMGRQNRIYRVYVSVEANQGPDRRKERHVFKPVFPTTRDARSAGGGFFCFFRCNPLKSPDSAGQVDSLIDI